MRRFYILYTSEDKQECRIIGLKEKEIESMGLFFKLLKEIREAAEDAKLEGKGKEVFDKVKASETLQNPSENIRPRP